MSNFTDFSIKLRELVRVYRRALREGRSIEELNDKVADKVKRMQVAQKLEQKKDQQDSRQLKRTVPAVVRVGANFLPVTLIVIGFLLLGSALVPIMGFYVKNLTQTNSEPLLAPIPKDQVLDATPFVVAQAGSGESLGRKLSALDSGPVVVDAELDYTNLSNWFEDDTMEDLENRSDQLAQHSEHYLLEIPKLGIERAIVKIGGTNLDQSLIQYPGTSLPGKPGSPVVFGHSVLRQFYNPKQSNPKRYNSIFSTIMTLEKGDKFYVKHGDVQYTYMVQAKKEVKPTDTYILAQDYSQRQFKLVTCVPEGTYLRRGVITAQLVKE